MDPDRTREASKQATTWGLILGVVLFLGSSLSGLVGLVFMVIVFAGVGGGLYALFTGVADSEVARLAISEAEAAPVGRNCLGTPIEPGWWNTSSWQGAGDGQTARIEMPVNGSKASGELYIKAAQFEGEWSLTRLRVQCDGRWTDLR